MTQEIGRDVLRTALKLAPKFHAKREVAIWNKFVIPTSPDREESLVVARGRSRFGSQISVYHWEAELNEEGQPTKVTNQEMEFNTFLGIPLRRKILLQETTYRPEGEQIFANRTVEPLADSQVEVLRKLIESQSLDKVARRRKIIRVDQ